MKWMYVLMVVLLVMTAMSGCVDEGVETNAVEEIEVVETAPEPEVVDESMEWTKQDHDSQTIFGVGYEVYIEFTTEPWIVEYTGSDSRLTLLKGRMERGVESGSFTLEEAQYIYEECGGTDALFETIDINTTTEADDGDYIEGSAGFSVNYLVDPPEVTYFGDPNAVDTTLRRSLRYKIMSGDMSVEEAQYIFEQCGGNGSVLEKVQLPEVEPLRRSLRYKIMSGDMSVEEAQYIFEQCGGNGSVLEKVQLPEVELVNLEEIEPPSDEGAYLILSVESEIRALNEEEQAMYEAYKAQFSDAHMEEWTEVNFGFILNVGFAGVSGVSYTYIDGVWYVGERVM